MLAYPILNWEMIAMAFSTNSTSGNGLSSEINVTPLIDVLLVMLIVFMVIVPVMPRGLDTVLPSSRAGSGDALPVLVEVKQELGSVRYSVDGAGLGWADVTPRLTELLARRSTRLVLLRADAALSYSVVSGVIDAGHAAGAESVELITPGVKAP